MRIHSYVDYNVVVLYCNRVILLHFWASWSEPSRQVSDVIIDLADEYTNCKFVEVSNYLASLVYRAMKQYVTS